MFITLAAFYIVRLSPQEQWIYGFIGYSIPFLFLFNFLFLFYWLLKRSWKIIFPILVVVVGWSHIKSTWQWNQEAEIAEKDFKVLNYNVRVFNVYDHLLASNPNAPDQMINWIADQNSDILCLQEFYNDKSSSTFNAKDKLESSGLPFSYVFAGKVNRIGAEFGLAIFSRYPMINKDYVDFNNPEQNKAMYSDIVIKTDTVRIYNVHFHSMKLRVGELMNEKEESIEQIRDTFYRMKEGFKAHAKEADILKNHILKSPYPVLLAGDFNDLPYSYTYLTFREFLQNSFEEKGNGFGFTYSGKPSFIRIDNQFSSESFSVKSHVVHDTIPYSDHYPISVVYGL